MKLILLLQTILILLFQKTLQYNLVWLDAYNAPVKDFVKIVRFITLCKMISVLNVMIIVNPVMSPQATVLPAIMGITLIKMNACFVGKIVNHAILPLAFNVHKIIS